MKPKRLNVTGSSNGYPLVIRLGLRVDGEPSPYSGAYLVDFPGRLMTWPDGSEAYIFTVSDDMDEARQFTETADALDYWQQSIGIRRDGEQDRPLTEFNVSVQEFRPVLRHYVATN